VTSGCLRAVAVAVVVAVTASLRGVVGEGAAEHRCGASPLPAHGSASVHRSSSVWSDERHSSVPARVLHAEGRRPPDPELSA
jgi:hypothetical protein